MRRNHLGDAIAALWASDSAIYGRFGYGSAVEAVSIDLDRAAARFQSGLPVPDKIEMITTETAGSVLPPLYERIRREVPGTFARSEAWWQHRRLRDTPDRREGKTALRIAVSHASDGTPSGYVMFRIESKFDGAHSDDQLHIIEMFGTSPSAWIALWTLVMGFDLVTNIKAEKRPVDDPIFEYLEGLRRVRRTLTDTLWVRVLDVAAAMRQRAFAAKGTVVLAIDDSMGFTSGTHRITWDGTEASHDLVTDAPDLSVDVADVGNALMGRPTFTAGVRAGTVIGSIESAVRADQFFSNDRAPFCPEVF